VKVLKLETGKYYKTRDGRKVYLVATECPGDVLGDEQPRHWPVIGWVKGMPRIQMWHHGGRHDSWKEELDLVAEWREPRTQTVTILMQACALPDAPPYVCVEGHQMPQFKTLARKEITITEGEGIEPKE
jgi:hypothetical protein